MIIQGDCIEEMKKLKENSVDAIVTDPPYGLEFMGKEWDRLSGKGRYQKAGVWQDVEGYSPPSYQGGFQAQVFHNQWAVECLRVLKPGGFLLSFGGTRTYHRMACGIEDAGFEIRDTIMWLYGSGFPKSLNIGKQIDKIQGNEREVVGTDGTRPIQTGGRINSEESAKGSFDREDNMITKGNSKWEGWGTALKPANEPIVVARKPLSEKNVALNVLKWGTGGINIDACRVGLDGMETHKTNAKSGLGKNGIYEKSTINEIEGNDLVRYDSKGRFPANIILDEEAGKLLGEPSRFFYCAKASKSERNLGCEELEDKTTDDGRELVSDSPHQRGVTKRKNNHPTVKPIKLMEYLIKLVSKEGATVLDPFLGSGTTGIACSKLNRKFIGIEKEEEYIKIAKARIKQTPKIK